jgi:hypothetical protein
MNSPYLDLPKRELTEVRARDAVTTWKVTIEGHRGMLRERTFLTTDEASKAFAKEIESSGEYVHIQMLMCVPGGDDEVVDWHKGEAWNS